MPDNPVRYTAVPDAIPKDGIWGEAGINVYNVAMSETETITTNSRVLGADPLVESGIGEEDMLTLVLPYVKTAREGSCVSERFWKSTEHMNPTGLPFQM